MIGVKELKEIAIKCGTPSYIFDTDVLCERIDKMQEILGCGVTVCYAMKANPFLIGTLDKKLDKFEVCSPGEFAICEKEGIDRSKIVLSGVNKEKKDILYTMKTGAVGIYTVESLNQLELINSCAVECGIKVKVLIRVTSGNQFGINERQVYEIADRKDELKGIIIEGIQCYSGTQKKKLSQIESEVVWLQAIAHTCEAEHGVKLNEIEYGPGLSVDYFVTDKCDAMNTNFDDLIDRLVSCVKKLREKSSVPILMLEHAGSSNMEMDTLQYSYVANVNAGSREAYEQLSAEGIPEIYYLSREELNLSMDSWVDLVHPNDFGMSQYANVVEMKVRDILNIPSSTSSTTCPVTQRRCVDYEWLDRHLKIVDLVCKKKPKAIILGNSITHYWGGDPSCDIKNGSECWEKEMNPRGYLNLGCAWDRIENLLWRVYHGELEGYEAEKIVVMIGINNVGLDSEEDIVKGIKFLLSEIRVRQPKADIKVVGLLPCRNQEHQVKSINKQLKRIAERDAYFYSDPGRLLLLDNGCIDECLFTDGTHLNEKGYNRIVKELISFE